MASTRLESVRRYWFALLLLGAGVFLALTGLRSVANVASLHQELTQLKSQSFDLVQAGHEARLQLQALQTEDAELERVARSKLQLVRPGEVLYVPEDPRRSRVPPRVSIAGR